MIRPLLVLPLMLIPSALAAASAPVSTQVPSNYGLSTLPAQTRDDGRVCLVEKKSHELVCRTRGEWRRVARRLEATSRSAG